MGPLGQAIVNGVAVAMVVALAYLIFAYPTAQRLGIALLLGTIVAVATYIHAKRT